MMMRMCVFQMNIVIRYVINPKPRRLKMTTKFQVCKKTASLSLLLCYSFSGVNPTTVLD